MSRLLPLTLLALLVLAGPAAAASWTPTATVAPSADPQFALAMGTDGTAAAVWARGGIRVAVKRPGRAWSTPRRVSDGVHTVTRPAVAVTGRGEVLVAWAQSGATGGSHAITGPLTVRARARGRGGAWGATRRLGTTGHFTEAQVQLAANDRGDAIALWRGTARAGASRTTEAVQSAFRRPDAAFGRAQTIDEPEARRAITGGVVALDDQRRAYAAWTSTPFGTSRPTVRMATRGRGPGGSWGAVRTVGRAPASAPAIAVTAGGTALMAWRAAPLDSEGEGLQQGALWTATRLPGGGLTPSSRLDAGPTRGARLAVSPRGEAALTWVAGGVLHLATRPATGGAFGAPVVASGVRPGTFHGGAAYRADGTLLVAVDEEGRVRVLERPAGGELGSVPSLERPGAYPLIAAAGGRAVTAWITVSAAAPLSAAALTG